MTPHHHLAPALSALTGSLRLRPILLIALALLVVSFAATGSYRHGYTLTRAHLSRK